MSVASERWLILPTCCTEVSHPIYPFFVLPALAGKTHRDHFVPCFQLSVVVVVVCCEKRVNIWLYLPHALMDFNHYYVVRIFHPIHFVQSENTNTTVYQSDIIGNRMRLIMYNHECWFPFTCNGFQCCLATKCFLLKIIILGGSLHLLWFLVLFGSNVFSTQNSTFQVVPFTSMVPSVWLKCVFHWKSIFWVIPVLFLWFPVLLGFKIIHFFFMVTSVVKFQGWLLYKPSNLKIKILWS